MKTRCAQRVLVQQPNTVLKLYASSVWCSFPSLIAWLEAVVCGVQECAFGWDAEGPEGRFEWSRSVDDRGHLTVLWDRDNLSHRVMLERRQMVGAIYGGFRKFAESADYHPEHYEPPAWFSTPLRGLRSPMIERWLALFDGQESGDKHVH